jgi:prepilin peptidase CpaA
MLDALALCAFAGLLIYAAISDFRSLIISNWISIALAGLFPVFALALGVPAADIGLHIVFGLGVLAVGFFLFAANIFGGGDAKLLAATAVWTGIDGFMTFAFWTALAGGILALALLAARHLVKQPETQPAIFHHLLKPRGGVPYGVAIMVGGLMSIPALPFGFAALTMP